MTNFKSGNAGAANGQQGQNAPGRRTFSPRERVMIFVLIILAAACAFYFLLFMPGMNRLEAIEEEAVQAEAMQAEYSEGIIMGTDAAQRLADSSAAYETAAAKLFTPMTYEMLDTTVTGYLTNAGFKPRTLNISQLEPEALTPFITDPLAESPTGETPETPETPDAPEGDVDDTSESAETVPPNIAIYSYSLDVTADGKWSNFYNLSDALAAADGIVMSRYSYAGSNGGDSAGSFSITFKLYVFAESAAADTE
jgi:hypothetical protein